MIGGFAGFVGNTARVMANDPWAAMGVLDDLPGMQQNAKVLMPLVAYSAAKRERGEKLAELTSGTVGIATFPTMATAAGAVLKLVMPTFGGPIAMLVGTVLLTTEPNEWLRKSVFRSMRTLQGFDRQTRRLEMGGDFGDTETSRAWRMSAIREMGATHQAARSYLGREAALMR